MNAATASEITLKTTTFCCLLCLVFGALNLALLDAHDVRSKRAVTRVSNSVADWLFKSGAATAFLIFYPVPVYVTIVVCGFGCLWFLTHVIAASIVGNVLASIAAYMGMLLMLAIGTDRAVFGDTLVKEGHGEHETKDKGE